MRIAAVALLGITVISLNGIYANAGVVAFYDFEENTPPSGTLTDGGSGSPITLTKVNSPTYSTDTPINGAGIPFGGHSLQASGTSYEYGNPGANTKMELQHFTIEAWIKTTSNDGGTSFDYCPQGAGSDGRGFIFGAFDGEPYLEIGDGSGPFKALVGTGTAFTLNTWHHIAGSFDSGTLRVFVDGVQEGSLVTTSAVLYSDTSSRGPVPKTVYIGAYHNANPSSSSTFSDLAGLAPAGTLLDRVILLDQAASGISGDGSVAPLLDFPEPASSGMLAIIAVGALALRRRSAAGRQS